MAQPIQDPTVGTALQALFGLQGRVRPALEEFVIPVVNVANLARNAPPPVTGMATATCFVAGVAGQYPTLRFEVPGSILAELVYMEVQSGSAGLMGLAFRGNAATIAALAGSASKSFADGRLLSGSPGGLRYPAGALTYGTQAGLLASVHDEYQYEANAARKIDFPPGIVCGTGRPDVYGFIEFQFSTAAAQLNRFTLGWREYAVV